MSYSVRIMPEIFFINMLKNFIGIVCYIGTAVIGIDQLTETDLLETLDISPTAAFITMWLLILLWVLKICWYAYDKFYLERRERLAKIKKAEMDNKKD